MFSNWFRKAKVAATKFFLQISSKNHAIADLSTHASSTGTPPSNASSADILSTDISPTATSSLRSLSPSCLACVNRKPCFVDPAALPGDEPFRSSDLCRMMSPLSHTPLELLDRLKHNVDHFRRDGLAIRHWVQNGLGKVENLVMDLALFDADSVLPLIRAHTIIFNNIFFSGSLTPQRAMITLLPQRHVGSLPVRLHRCAETKGDRETCLSQSFYSEIKLALPASPTLPLAERTEMLLYVVSILLHEMLHAYFDLYIEEFAAKELFLEKKSDLGEPKYLLKLRCLPSFARELVHSPGKLDDDMNYLSYLATMEFSKEEVEQQKTEIESGGFIGKLRLKACQFVLSLPPRVLPPPPLTRTPSQESDKYYPLDGTELSVEPWEF
ncbi:hypothetical protein N431DRAFT_486152 [Stipitochalara longipes BDJ]|nr:hypothetical protein N431DRAFT_486152 [Stipitochalara longipes BDJ]